MVYEILATTPFGKEKKGEVGIERMVEEGAYSAAFPLHDVRTQQTSQNFPFLAYLFWVLKALVPWKQLWEVHFLLSSFLIF